MTEETPTPPKGTPEPEGGGALPGQITQPNPLEVFWEKNKKAIIGAAVVIILVIGAKYAWDYKVRLERNETWTKTTEAAGLRSSFAPSEDNPINFLIAKNYQDYATQLHEKSPEQIKAGIGSLPPAAANLLRYFLASRHALTGDIEAVSSTLADLETADPKASLFQKQDFPPVFVAKPEKAEDDEAKKKKKGQEEEAPPDPAPAVLKDVLLARARANQAFRQEHSRLYEAPTPDGKPDIVFETTEGSFTVRLYAAKAPKHCASFVEKCKSGYYNGLRFHQLERGDQPKVELAMLGDPESKDEDTAKWGAYKSEKQIEREDSGVSHFPFMLAAYRQSDKIDSEEGLVYFTGIDCAESRDGSYVVFGRVVEGQDVLRRITQGRFASEAEKNAGSGKPADPVRVEKVTVKA